MMLVMAIVVTPILAQEPDEEELESATYEFTEDMTARNIGALSDPATEILPVQGQLTDGAGNPITGDRSVTFSVYESATGGTAKCSSTQTVTITEGFFSTEITGCDTGDIRGFQMFRLPAIYATSLKVHITSGSLKFQEGIASCDL